MEYRVCRNNPAPYNDLNGKISLLGLGTMRLPLRDAAVWLENLLLTALCAVSAARFSHAQRRGSFSIAPFIALALTVGSFFFRMGSSTTILLCMVTAAALGITMMQFLKGATDDDAKTDFRTAQDA